MIEEILKKLGLLAWEVAFILKYSRGSTEQALRMAAEHVIRNAAAAGEDLAPHQKKFETMGITVFL